MSRGLAGFLEFRQHLIADGWDDGADRTLADLMTVAVAELAGPLPAGAAVCATGGFGRGVMAIHSDVDLLFLHSGREVEELARRVLRPLWDARLKVGHLSHTPKSARIFAGTRLDAVSTFLSARLISGDGDAFDDFVQRMRGLLDKEHGRISEGMAAEERRRRDEEPYRLMAADLKAGRGGLRTLDLVDWRRRVFLAQSADPPEPGIDDAAVRSRLNEIRSAVHVAAGRAHDRYDFELREPAARWLGMTVRDLGREVIRLRSTIERMVDAVWPSVANVPRRGPLPGCLRPEWRGDVVAWFDQTIPALGSLLDVPHVVPFHRHAVGDHVLATVDLAWVAVDRALDDPVAREAAASVDRPERLVLAALFHDIGKGRDGDHSREGAAMVADAAAELGVDPADVPLLVRLTEHHLLLADLATRFDLDDPDVVSWAADRIPDLETLRFLLLLTVVDSMAAGPDVWTPWRAELVRRAFRRLERELIRRALPDESQVMALADAVAEASGGVVDSLAVRTHLAGFGPAYRRSHAPELIADHMRLAGRLSGVGVVDVHPGAPARIVVIAADRPHLLVDVATVLAANRLSITDARFAARSDGVVFDTFEVVDAVVGRPDPGRLSAVQNEIRRVLRGGFDASSSLAEKENAYRDTTRTVPTHVSVVRSNDGGGVVEIETGDRLGLLRDLGRVFDRFGMPVIRARADTRGGVAYDTFQVARLPVETAPLVESLRAAAAQV